MLRRYGSRKAIDLESVIRSYDPVIASSFDDYNIGQVEDMNVIIQNSLWQSVPVSKLHLFGQVQSLAGNKQKWAKDQLKRMGVVADQINALESRIIGSM
jgi:chromosome partitioning protein